MDWQPISTAPKDGRPILVCGGDGLTVAYWDDRAGWAIQGAWRLNVGEIQGDSLMAADPTGWSPLPDAVAGRYAGLGGWDLPKALKDEPVGASTSIG